MISYALKPALSGRQLEEIVGAGIMILDRIGIECKHAGIQKKLRLHNGVRLENDRFHFSAALCEDTIQKIRTRKGAPGKHGETAPRPAESRTQKLKLTGPFACINLLDPTTHAIRPATLQDLTETTRLMEGLGVEGRKIIGPVMPMDVPDPLRCLAMCRAGWQWSSTAGGGIVASVTEVKYLHEMGRIASVKPPYAYVEFVISPLAFNSIALDIVYQLLNTEEFEALWVHPGPIPTLGGTGPISVAGLLAQSTAETLGGAILLELLTDGKRSIGCSHISSAAVDMRSGAVVFSSPEAILLQELGNEVGAYLCGKFGGGGGMRTTAKAPDAQAACEKLTCALLAAMNGCHSFCDGGTLAVDDVFSAEQLVIDLEILNFVERLVRGHDFDAPQDSLRVIAECLDARNFLSHPTTIERFREIYWNPALFDRRSYSAWVTAEKPTIHAKAAHVIRDTVRDQSPRLDESASRALDEAYQKGCAAIGRDLP